MLDLLMRQAAILAKSQCRSGRLRSPSDHVARMSRRIAGFGITRVADTTGLDCIGWPVWAAIRPNARTLSVSQGKGATDEAARASAIMEAVEMACAECVQAEMVAGADEMVSAGCRVDRLPGLVRRNYAVPGGKDRIGWLRGHDLIHDRAVWIPADAVKIDPDQAHRPYWQSSDGLGSGSLLLEAVLHGLCERIERDAAELWNLRSDREIADACVDPSSIGSDEVAHQSRAIARSGLRLRLFDITSDLGVPTYFAAVSPPPNGREVDWVYFDLATGTASRLDRGAAAAAAIGEALQSRVTTISGARDDYHPDIYALPIAPDLLIYPRCEPSQRQAQTQPGDAGIGMALPRLLSALRSGGVTSAIAVQLHSDEDFTVAKLIVPGLEHPPGARAVEHGPRLAAAMRIAA